MKKPLHHIALAALSSLFALGGALAQDSTQQIDLDSIRARAASQSAEAEALATQARDRAKAVTADARQTAEAGRANGLHHAGKARVTGGIPSAAFDFDAMVAEAGAMSKEGMGEAPRFIAFASLSMPPAALKAMVADVTRAGGAVVFRGLTGGSARTMTQALGAALEAGSQTRDLGIDPRLFRAFGIDAVPAYVVTASDFDLCDGLDCSTPVPPHDRMSGNVTAAHALETIAQGGGPGARIAALHLARLERKEP